MKLYRFTLPILAISAVFAYTTAFATLVSVSGPLSSQGVAASIIGAPSDALDDLITNMGMNGFDEAQGVVTSVAHATDGGIIASGTLVDSHMIFLNSPNFQRPGNDRITHDWVTWTFSGTILGVMSDVRGQLEAASTFELGAPGTNYTVTGPGTGAAAPFANRGFEGNDDYNIIAPNQLQVKMGVTEPGDWIRVVTAVPEPTTMLLFGTGLAGLAAIGRRRQK